jgi:hypothetical protein
VPDPTEIGGASRIARTVRMKNLSYKERSPDVQWLFEQKNQGGYPDCPYHHPEGKRVNVCEFTRKKNGKF